MNEHVHHCAQLYNIQYSTLTCEDYGIFSGILVNINKQHFSGLMLFPFTAKLSMALF